MNIVDTHVCVVRSLSKLKSGILMFKSSVNVMKLLQWTDRVLKCKKSKANQRQLSNDSLCIFSLRNLFPPVCVSQV